MIKLQVVGKTGVTANVYVNPNTIVYISPVLEKDSNSHSRITFVNGSILESLLHVDEIYRIVESKMNLTNSRYV
jgi:hypothetical protein